MALRRRLGWMAVAGGFGILACSACNAVLGLDAPSLATCDGGCVDASTDQGPVDDTGAPPGTEGGADAVAEASLDGAADGPVAMTDAGPDAAQPDGGIRCGGGAYPTSWCVVGQQQCCQAGTASSPTFTCVPSGSCTGYAIQCANYNDCGGTDICCHFMAHQICDAPANCANDVLVCDGTTTDVCPTSWKCDVPFVGDAAASSPYLGCGP